MIRSMQMQILKFMKVPAEPKPPEGSAGSIRIFRAGQNYYRWRLFLWLLTTLGILIPVTILLFAISRGIRASQSWGRITLETIAGLLVVGVLLSLLVTFLQVRLNYELRWYIVTDRCLRVRHGIMNVHELTTTFANIQEVRLSAGPLQKVLGLADVEVHSAGGGGRGPSDDHAARFEGVDNAPEIRDFILERLRQYRDSGLGEKDSKHPSESGEGIVAAAREVLVEARALRAVFSRES